MWRSQKHALPVTSYTFSDGPFRDINIRYGYDPRTDPQARLYQTIMFRNIEHPYIKQPLNAAPRGKQTGVRDPFNRHTHQFDGQTVHATIGTFQLTDITDPLVAGLVHAPEAVADECSGGPEGWYKVAHFEQIKAVLRRKFTGLLQGREVGEEDCADLLGDPEEMERLKKAGKGRPKGRPPGAMGNGKRREVRQDEEQGEEGEEEEGGVEMGVGMTSEVERDPDDLQSEVEGMSVDGEGAADSAMEGEENGDAGDEDAGDLEPRDASEPAATSDLEREPLPTPSNQPAPQPTPQTQLVPEEPEATPASPPAAATPTRTRATRSGQAGTPLGTSAAKPSWVKGKKRIRGGPKKRTETEAERRERLARLIGGIQPGTEGDVGPGSEAGAEGEGEGGREERDGEGDGDV